MRSHGAAGPSQVVASAGPVTLAQGVHRPFARTGGTWTDVGQQRVNRCRDNNPSSPSAPDRVQKLTMPSVVLAELEEEAAALMDREASFNVVVVQFNGGLQRQKVVSVLRVSPSGVALHGVDGSVRCQAAYHDQMQVPS